MKDPSRERAVQGELRDPSVKPLSFFERYEDLFLSVTGFAIFLAVWEAITRLGLVSALVLVPPSVALSVLAKLILTGEIVPDIIASLEELFIGFAISVLIGIPVGLVLGWYRRINSLFDSLFTVLYATPRVALLPFLTIIFGVLGIWRTTAYTTLLAFFPISVTTMEGVKSHDRNLVAVARSFGATDKQIFKLIVLRAAVPHILAGLKLGMVIAIIGVVVGEFFGAQRGLGYLLVLYGNIVDTAALLAIVILVSVIGLILYVILKRLEDKYESWRVTK